jgi:hypothetical protein
MRAARIILITQVVTLAICAPVQFCLLAFSTRPHHVASASLTTFITVVILGSTARWLYRVKMAQASRLDDTAGNGPAYMA